MRGKFRVGVLDQDAQNRGPLLVAEGGLASQEFIERAAQAVDVRAMVNFTFDHALFGRHVMRRPQPLSRLRQEHPLLRFA